MWESVVSLTLRIIDSPKGEAIREWQKIFPEDGGTIGRAATSTMMLSDFSRTVSGTHVILIKSPSGYRVVDTSTNGLYINGAREPLGLQNQAALNDGDVLDVGGYRLLVSCFEPSEAQEKQSPLDSWKDYDPFGDESCELGLDENHSIPKSDSWENNVFSHAATQSKEEKEDKVTLASNKVDIFVDPFLEEQGDDDEDGVEDTQYSVVSHDAEIENFSELNDKELFSVNTMESSVYQLNENYAVFDQVSSYESGAKKVKVSNFSYSESENKNSTVLTVPLDVLDSKMMLIIDRAFRRFLEDVSPETIEKMANDLFSTSKLFRKHDYWKLYKALFKRQFENSEWSLKFKAYLLESQRLTKYMK